MRGMGDAEIMKYVLGMSGADSTFISDITDLIAQDGGSYYDKILSASIAQRMMDDLNSKRTGPGYAMKNWWGSAKDTMGDFFAPIGEGWNATMEGLQDWWYSKEYYDVKKLWSGVDFTENYDYSEIANRLSEAADKIGKNSSGLAGSLEKAAQIIGKANESVNDANMIASQNNISNYGWGKLTDYGAFRKDYSMWDGTNAKANYIEAMLGALNEAGNFGISISDNGFYSQKAREDILSQSFDRYKAIMRGNSVTKVDYNFAKAFEEYNLNISKVRGFDDYFYGISGMGVEGKDLAFKPDKSYSEDAKTLEGVVAQIEEMGKIEKGFSVAAAKLNGPGSISEGGYKFTLKQNGKWDIAPSLRIGADPEAMASALTFKDITWDTFHSDLSYLWEQKEGIDKVVGDFEAYKTGYTALAGLVGMSDANQRGITAMFGDDVGNLDIGKDTASAVLASHMFSDLPIGSLVGDTKGLKEHILGQSWVGNLGGTQVVGNAIDSWMSSSSITEGSSLTEGALKDLVNQILAAATAGGNIDDASKKDREIAQAEDVAGIREILYNAYVTHWGKHTPKEGQEGYDVYQNYEADKKETNYDSRGSEVNVSGTANSGTTNSGLPK
jgi:hypothetical protein